jgi:hypothetical protein
MAKSSKKGKAAKRERRERRFLPRATTPPALVYAMGALGAFAMGAGLWAQWGRTAFLNVDESLPFAPWLLAGAAVLLGIAIWFGTSGEPPLRVGDAGIAVEKGALKRVPWHAVERVSYDSAGGAVVAKGTSETGEPLEIRARVASQEQAAAWIVREARARVPAVVDVRDQVTVPEAHEDGGETLKLDPLQVVGKRCAESGTIIAFEPDARVCARCERVYHREHVPSECACGGAMSGLQASGFRPQEEEKPGDAGSRPEA